MKHGTVSLHHIPRNAYIYFVDPITFSSAHPYIVFNGDGNAIWSHYPVVLLPLAWLFLGRFEKTTGLNGIQDYRPDRANPENSGTATADAGKTQLVVLSFLGLWVVYFAFLCCLVWTGYFAFCGRYLCDVERLLLVVILYVYLQLRSQPVWRAVSLIAMFACVEIKLIYICAAQGIL